MWGSVVILLSASMFSCVFGEIPSYIKICKKTDPNLSQCMIDSIDHLRPKLKDGILELDVPPLEPLPLNEIKLRSGPDQVHINANITNLLIHGPSLFKITDLKPDLAKTRFLVQFTIPTLTFEGDYDIDMNVLLIKYKGKGPITGKFTDYVFTCILKADKIKKGEETYIQFRKIGIKLTAGKSELSLGNLFDGNGGALAQATNEVLTENADVFIDEIKPVLEESLGEKFTAIANSITSKFTFAQLFPE